jgi:acetyl esterase/lipase
LRLGVAATAVAVGMTAAAALSGLCDMAASGAATTTTSEPTTHAYPHLTVNSTFADVLDNPAFAGFGDDMLVSQNPSQVKAMEGASIQVLSNYFEQNLGEFLDAQTMVNGLNFMIDEVNSGVKIWHPLYSKKAIAADPSKAPVGIWFIPGDPSKPLAVIAAGGAFVSVSSIQEAFPHAEVLHGLGYNVAILRYRVITSGVGTGSTTTTSTTPGGTTTTQQPAQSPAQKKQMNIELTKMNQDMAAAMTMLRNNAQPWHINLRNYSIWGSSAGGVMMDQWAGNGPTGATAHGFPKPAVVVAAYTPPPYPKISRSLPPYFITDAANDNRVSPAAVAANAAALKAAGVDVEFERYPSGGHGFGLGVGTPAYGWVNKAVAFWQAHMKE